MPTPAVASPTGRVQVTVIVRSVALETVIICEASRGAVRPAHRPVRFAERLIVVVPAIAGVAGTMRAVPFALLTAFATRAFVVVQVRLAFVVIGVREPSEFTVEGVRIVFSSAAIVVAAAAISTPLMHEPAMVPFDESMSAVDAPIGV